MIKYYRFYGITHKSQKMVSCGIGYGHTMQKAMVQLEWQIKESNIEPYIKIYSFEECRSVDYYEWLDEVKELHIKNFKN